MQPLQFLAKPLDGKKVENNMKLAMKMINKDHAVFTYKMSVDTHRILLQDVLYFESQSRKIKLVSVKETVEFYGKIKEDKGKNFTSKKDKENHGLGIESVRAMLKRYHGDLEIEYDEKCFTAIVYIYTESI